MAKLSTRRPVVEHPLWCAVPYFGPDDHDPHVSHHERIRDDLPTSGFAVEAYLHLPKRPPDPRQPEAPLATLEFRPPHGAPTSVVLSFGQLRRLSEALDRLVHQGEIAWPS